VLPAPLGGAGSTELNSLGRFPSMTNKEVDGQPATNFSETPLMQ